MVTITSCVRFIVDGFVFGSGIIDNCNPYNILFAITTCSDCTFRNGGSVFAPLLCGSNPSLYPLRILNDSTKSSGIKVQRVFAPTRAAPINTNSSTLNILLESVGIGATSGTWSNTSNNHRQRACRIIPPNSSLKAAGAIFFDGFTSDIDGYNTFMCQPASIESASFITTNFVDPTSGFDGNGYVILRTAGDSIVYESPYWILGHTACKNTAPLLTPATYLPNLLVEYAIDTGSGYGAWKTLDASNLSTEGLNPAGYKIKIRITAAVSNPNNRIQYVNIYTDTSLLAQDANRYPLDQVTLSFEGLQPGSEVRAYVGTDPATAVEIGGIESVPGTTWSFQHSSAGQEGYIAVFALGYNPLIIPRTYASTDSTLLISQVVDRNYVNP